MAKSAPFFPCSTLFLADDFHFELLSLLFTGCFSHNPPCSIQSFSSSSHLSFQDHCRCLRLTLQDQDISGCVSEQHSNKVQNQKRETVLLCLSVNKRKEVQNGTFTKPFLTECRRAAQQQCCHRNQKNRKKHLNSSLPRTKKLKSLRYVSLFWYNNVYMYACLSPPLYVYVKYL